jgi:hypothetical protein
MSISVRNGSSVWEPVKSASVYSSGTWNKIRTARVYNGSVWQIFHGMVLTGGTYTGGGGGYGYSTYPEGATSSFGTLSGNSTVWLSSSSSGTLTRLMSTNGGVGPMGIPLQIRTELSVDGGDFTSTTWDSITVGNPTNGYTSVNRTSAYSTSYDSANNRTIWLWDFDSGQTPTNITPFAPADAVANVVYINF